MAAIIFPTDAESREDYIISAPWTDPVNGGDWWFSETKVRWLPVVAGAGASDFADLGGLPSENAALDAALDLKAPLASPTFTGTVTSTGTVNAGARVTASRGTVGVGTVYTNEAVTAIAGTGTDFLSRFVVGDSITFNTVNGPEERVITAINSDSSMTTLPFSAASATGAEAYTHTTASAVMNPSGAVSGTTGTFSGAVSGTTGFFTGAVTAGGTNNWTGSIFSGAQAFSGSVSVTDATASTTTTTGALKVAGGLGVGGAINAGGAITGTTITTAAGGSNIQATLGASTFRDEAAGRLSLNRAFYFTTTSLVMSGRSLSFNSAFGGAATHVLSSYADGVFQFGTTANNDAGSWRATNGTLLGNLTASGTVTASNFKRGTGSPESVVTGTRGDIYTRTDGGANTTLYVKETGDATNTGWVAK